MSFKKKLLYRSAHRGCKEMDILLGNFAISCIDTLSDTQLQEYQKIIEQDDLLLYNIIVEKELIPEYLSSIVLQKIIDFHKQS